LFRNTVGNCKQEQEQQQKSISLTKITATKTAKITGGFARKDWCFLEVWVEPVSYFFSLIFEFFLFQELQTRS